MRDAGRMGEPEVFDVCVSAYALVCRQASRGALDTVSPGSYVVACADLSSATACARTLDCRVRATREAAIASAAEQRSRVMRRSAFTSTAFEVWHIVEDPSTTSMQIFADYVEVEDGRVRYQCGRFQDLAVARAYVADKWRLFVERYDDELAEQTRMASFGSYLDAFCVRIEMEQVFPLC